MEVPTSALELMQGVVDNRLGGDVAAVARGLELIEHELARPGMPMFEKVGNNCLVFFTNDQAKKVCEDNPETIQGVIVDDYDCWIHPEAVVIGSFLQGSVNSPARIDFESTVMYSNVVMGHVRRSRVVGSYVGCGKIEASTVVESFVSGNLFRSQLTRSTAIVGGATQRTAVDQILSYDPNKDQPDTDGHFARMLAGRGLITRAK